MQFVNGVDGTAACIRKDTSTLYGTMYEYGTVQKHRGGTDVDGVYCTYSYYIREAFASGGGSGQWQCHCALALLAPVGAELRRRGACR